MTPDDTGHRPRQLPEGLGQQVRAVLRVRSTSHGRQRNRSAAPQGLAESLMRLSARLTSVCGYDLHGGPWRGVTS